MTNNILHVGQENFDAVKCRMKGSFKAVLMVVELSFAVLVLNPLFVAGGGSPWEGVYTGGA